MFRPLTSRQLLFDVLFAVGCLLLRFAIGFESGLMSGVVVLMASALALRRVSPALALGVAWLGAILQMVGGFNPDLSNLAILAVLYSTARYGEPVVKWLGLGSAGFGALVATVYLSSPFSSFALFITFADIPRYLAQILGVGTGALAVLGLSWTFGLLARKVVEVAQSSRAEAAAQEVAVVEQERTRIARDMHDVVAHSLAVVIAQADGARYARATDPAAVDEALTTISTTARAALADVRLLLGQLRHSQDAGPQPMLADLDTLVDQLESSGLLVDQHIDGTPPVLGPSQQLALYRIVQEALTNALRHGDVAKPASLQIDYAPDAVSLEISSALRGSTTAQPTPGHGLAGMRERALLVGGTFEAAPAGDRFVVHARIPVTV